jgi:ABC-type uncharacterized transport system permease subunit
MILAFALLVHSGLWQAQVFVADGMRFGFAHAVSITLLLACWVLWWEAITRNASVLEALAYPAAAVGLLLPVFFPGTVTGTYADNVFFQAHLSVALAASSVVSLAAAQAVLMSLQERRLHSPRGLMGVASKDHTADGLTSVLDRLPPLLTMESLLFKLLTAGFVLLSLTLVSGALFSEQWLHKPMQFNHKTVFTVLSWAIFGSLLLGRHLRGWRGRTALRWTLAGVATLLLAYVGSRFVLEVILQRAV